MGIGRKGLWWCVTLVLLVGCSSQAPAPQCPRPQRGRTRPAEPMEGVAADPVSGDAPLKRSPLEPARRDYIFPFPQGFTPGESVRGTMNQAAARLASVGGAMLVTRHKGFGSGPLLGVIAVAPAVSGVGVSSDPGGCKRTARTLGHQTGHNITFAGLVPVGEGKGCQIRAKAGAASQTPHHQIIVTLVERESSAWIINCTFDDRDIVAIQGCKTVIAGWRFVR